MPERKIRVAVLGSLILYTMPGNCSGSYSAPSRARVMARRFSSEPMVEVATTFSILMVGSVDIGHRACYGTFYIKAFALNTVK